VIEAWGGWVEKEVGPNTFKRYACSLGVLAPFLESKFLDQIDGRLIAGIVRTRQATGKVTNATIRRDLGALSSVLRFAKGQGWRDDNPVPDRLDLITERRDPIILPRPEDVERMVARAPGMLASMISAARATGCRQEELANARRRHLDLNAKRLTVVGKGNKLRVIDLEPFGGVGIFAALPDGTPDAPLFWHGKAERYANVASRFARLGMELGEAHSDFRRFRFHDLRHLHAVEWLRSGRSIYDLQKRLGHASIKTTEGYLAYLTPDEERQTKQGAAVAQKGAQHQAAATV
jgi:integrase/recombinase XerD